MQGVFLLVALLLTSMQSMAAEGRTWATGVSKNENNGRAIVFRYVKEFPAQFQRSSYPTRVIIVWKYKSDGGMPQPKDRERMERLEDLLTPAIERDDQGSLALVSTGENLREWTYYVRSEEIFFRQLNKALVGEARLPIEIHAAPDKEWKTYETFRAGVRE